MATFDNFEDYYKNHMDDLVASNRFLAEEWQVSEATIRRWRKKLDGQIVVNVPANGAVRARKAIASFRSDLPKPMEVFGSAMITGDVHIPLTSQLMSAMLFEKRRQLDLSTLILGGDFWNFDSLSRFDEKQHDHTLEQEWDIGVEFFAALLDEFQNIYVIKGNHEDRFIRAFNGRMDYPSSMKKMLGDVYKQNADRIHISHLDHMYVYGSEGQKYYVCHPKAYSRTPLATGRALAAKHHCNIVCAHAHHHAVGTDISGKYVVVEMGGLFDADKAQYLREATTFPKQVNGLCWLDPNGRLVAWNPLFEFST